jgi:hypothetical protein
MFWLFITIGWGVIWGWVTIGWGWVSISWSWVSVCWGMMDSMMGWASEGKGEESQQSKSLHFEFLFVKC